LYGSSSSSVPQLKLITFVGTGVLPTATSLESTSLLVVGVDRQETEASLLAKDLPKASSRLLHCKTDGESGMKVAWVSVWPRVQEYGLTRKTCIAPAMTLVKILKAGCDTHCPV